MTTLLSFCLQLLSNASSEDALSVAREPPLVSNAGSDDALNLCKTPLVSAIHTLDPPNEEFLQDTRLSSESNSELASEAGTHTLSPEKLAKAEQKLK